MTENTPPVGPYGLSIAPPWSVDLEAAPKWKPLLVLVHDRVRLDTTRAVYLPEKSEVTYDLNELHRTYCHDEDVYYLDEGWYEVVSTDGPRYFRLYLPPVAWRRIPGYEVL